MSVLLKTDACSLLQCKLQNATDIDVSSSVLEMFENGIHKSPYLELILKSCSFPVAEYEH